MVGRAVVEGGPLRAAGTAEGVLLPVWGASGRRVGDPQANRRFFGSDPESLCWPASSVGHVDVVVCLVWGRKTVLAVFS